MIRGMTITRLNTRCAIVLRAGAIALICTMGLLASGANCGNKTTPDDETCQQHKPECQSSEFYFTTCADDGHRLLRCHASCSYQHATQSEGSTNCPSGHTCAVSCPDAGDCVGGDACR